MNLGDFKIPIPKPKKNEEQNKFISRCMSNDTMKDEFPDQKQRNAVCYDSWRKNKSSNIQMTKDCVSIVSKHYEVEKSGEKERYIEVPVSGLKEDRDNERMSEKAIQKMVEKLKSGVPLYLDHGKGDIVYSWKGIAGKSVDGWLKEENLIAKFKLNKFHPDHKLMWGYLNEGMPVGLSIGANPKSAHYEEIKDEQKN